MIVIRPIGHRSQCRTGCKYIGCCEQTHQGHETPIRSAIHADAFGVHVREGFEPVDGPLVLPDDEAVQAQFERVL